MSLFYLFLCPLGFCHGELFEYKNYASLIPHVPLILGTGPQYLTKCLKPPQNALLHESLNDIHANTLDTIKVIFMSTLQLKVTIIGQLVLLNLYFYDPHPQLCY